jgi:HK97 family phage prohead protease
VIRYTPTQTISVDAAASDGAASRTISGIAVEFDVVATVNDGQQVMFKPGSLPVDGRNPKLYLQHDPMKIIGQVTERLSTNEAMLFTAKISATDLGNESLVLISDGTLSEVSVGVDVQKFSYDKNGVMVIEQATFNELSVVSQPAFSGAVITDVAASIHETQPEIRQDVSTDEPKEETMEESPVVEASATVEKLWAKPRQEFKVPTAAQYLSAYVNNPIKFAEYREGIKAAAPSAPYIDTESNPGILPEIIVQNIYNNFVGMRPVVDAFGARPMPLGGQIFIRPAVSQNVSMAKQSAQNATLQAGTYQIDKLSVTKETYGGYVQISEQDIMFTTPEILGSLLDDMGRIYANTTDNVAADALVAGATVTNSFGNTSLPEDWVGWIGQSSQTILTNSNGNLPNALFVSPKYWGVLIGLADTTGRPLFPNLGPMNALGDLTPSFGQGMAFGLNVVVDRNFTDETIILGCAGTSPGNPTGAGFECYELPQGAISIDVPSQLARTLAFRGQFATLMIDADKFVKANGLP